MAKIQLEILTLPNGTGGEIYTAVDNSGNVIIWDDKSAEAYYFSLDEWEKMNVFVLNQFRKMNDKT